MLLPSPWAVNLSLLPLQALPHLGNVQAMHEDEGGDKILRFDSSTGFPEESLTQ